MKNISACWETGLCTPWGNSDAAASSSSEKAGAAEADFWQRKKRNEVKTKQKEPEGRGERGDVRSGTAERIRVDGSSLKSTAGVEVDGRKEG